MRKDNFRVSDDELEEKIANLKEFLHGNNCRQGLRFEIKSRIKHHVAEQQRRKTEVARK